MQKTFYLIFFLVFTLNASAQFTAGNLAVLQAAGSASNTTCSVIEINKTTPSQPAISTVAIVGTGTNAVRFSGSATSTCYMATSNDGSLLCFTGVNNTDAVANTNTLNPRTVVTLNAAQAFAIATTYTGTSGNQTRCATSLNNVNWFIGDQGGLYTNGSTGASPSGNPRSVRTFGGVVYGFTASASAAPVYTISATTGSTFVGLPGLANGATSRQDFYMISSGSNGSTYDVLYVLDATSNTVGTIFKYSLVGGLWTANGSVATTFGGFGMAAEANAGSANLYITTGQGAAINNSVIKVVDAAGYNATIAVTPANNVTLFTTTGSKILKGVAFAPVAAATPIVVPSATNVAFGSIPTATFSSDTPLTLSAANLTTASGNITVTAPNTNFQVSNDGTTWGASTTIAYSGNGATIGTLHIRFTPQTSGTKSGNVAITGGGLPFEIDIAVTGTGTNALSLAFGTNGLLNPPYVSGTINDVDDPAKIYGLTVTAQESSVDIPAANYTITASSSNTAVVANANVVVTKSDGQANIKITPTGVGYADVTLTLTKGTDTKTLVINYAASTATASSGTRWHTGFADASGALAIDDTYMSVADDEKNTIFVFDRSHSGLPVQTFDFNQGNILGLTDGSTNNWKEVDVEAATASTTIAGKSYWLGSMSNSSSFNDKPNRNRLFALTQTGTGASTAFSNAGYYAGLRQQLITWGDAHGYDFGTSAADGHDSKVIDGFNVEGVAFGPDNTSLYIGFRAPLVPMLARTKAVIAPLQNFEAWFNNGLPSGAPTFGAPIELDLGGRGIRDLIRLANGIYVIAAGSYDGTPNAALYKWSGNAAEAPVQMTSFDLTGLNVEGILPVNVAGQLSLEKLELLSDDGDKVFYGDAIAAKDLAQDNFKKFNASVVTSSILGVLPVTFESFSATRNNNTALLTWKVGQAADLRSFDILRSTDGINFDVIGTVAATTTQLSYSFTDKTISSAKTFYRIRAIEDNSANYASAIRTVSGIANLVAVKIYPNPVTNDNFTITVNTQGNKVVRIYSADGKLYKEMQFTANQLNINTATWPKGIYNVRVMQADETSVNEKLLVQ